MKLSKMSRAIRFLFKDRVIIPQPNRPKALLIAAGIYAIGLLLYSYGVFVCYQDNSRADVSLGLQQITVLSSVVCLFCAPARKIKGVVYVFCVGVFFAVSSHTLLLIAARSGYPVVRGPVPELLFWAVIGASAFWGGESVFLGLQHRD